MQGLFPGECGRCEKKPLTELIYSRGLDALVSGISLEKNLEVDAPQVNVQYSILEREDETHELVEKMYFDHLADFIYVEFMKGLQKGFVPKRCANCGQWFLQEPWLTYNYCKQVALWEAELTFRDIGSKASFGIRSRTTKSGRSTSGPIRNTLPGRKREP